MKHHLLLLLLCLGNLSAATYYIDYVGGSDSNNGTAKATPWKHCPYMQPFSGSYTHSPGDDFIFKGGVTWPRAAVPIVITQGGTSGNHMLFGVDQTWYTGGSFTKPRFTSGGLSFVNNTIDHRENMFRVIGTSTNRVRFVDFDNLYIYQWPMTEVVPTNWIDGFGICIEQAGSVRITDCEVHDWEPRNSGAVLGPTTGYPNGKPRVGDGGGFNAPLSSSYDGYFEAIDCIIEGPLSVDANTVLSADQTPQQLDRGGGYTSGNGARNLTKVERCTISRVTQGVWSCFEVYDNELFDIGADKDGTVHENGFRPTSRSTIMRGNWIHDTQGAACQSLWGQICFGGVTNRYAWIYNNIFGPRIGVCAMTGDGNVANSQNEYWFYNNLIISIPSTIGLRSGAAPYSGPCIMANNICISDTQTVNGAFPEKSPSTSFLEAHIFGTAGNNKVITHAQATAAGMTEARRYKPNQAISGVTGAGLNLSGTNPWGVVGGNILTFNTDFDGATRSAPWDVGPYEFGGAPAAIPGNIQLTSDTFSNTEGSGIVITASRGGGDDGAVGVSYATSTPAGSTATSGTDFTAASGTLSWANGDSANKTVTITTSDDATVEGDESFVFTISAATGGASLGTPVSAVVTIVDNESTGSLIPLMPGLTFDVDDMLRETPFVTTGTLVDQPIQTTTPSSGGRARARVTIPSSGNYRVAMNVNANNTGSDSLFIDFDGEPTSPTTIWDVLPLTTGTTPQPRNVSWRGTGTFDAPQFVDKEWTLSAGEHTLYIRGREANMDLQSVTIFPEATVDVTPPTPNPATIADVQASSVSVIIESEVVADITEPVQYQFEVTGPEPDGVGSFTSNLQSDPSITVPLYPGLKYRLRVRSQDSASPPNVGSWSEPITIEVPTIEGAGARRR